MLPYGILTIRVAVNNLLYCWFPAPDLPKVNTRGKEPYFIDIAHSGFGEAA
jgi:hypothetical protein